MDNDSADVAWNKNRRWKMEVGGNAVRLGNRQGVGINDVAAIGHVERAERGEVQRIEQFRARKTHRQEQRKNDAGQVCLKTKPPGEGNEGHEKTVASRPSDSRVDVCSSLVAQIGNLLYRRLAVGSAPLRPTHY